LYAARTRIPPEIKPDTLRLNVVLPAPVRLK
jgi:hypothetical protein